MRRWLALLALGAVGAAVPVLALEAGLRLLYPQPRIMAVDEVLGSRPEPHLDVRKTYGGHERVVRVTTNAQGLRGEGGLGPKLHSVRRVLALGDSFTFGDAVEAHEAWPRQLEAALGPSGATPLIEVVNAGVSGETSAAALRRIEWVMSPCSRSGGEDSTGEGTLCPVSVLVLEQGANDALRGLDLAAARRNLQEIIDRARARGWVEFAELVEREIVRLRAPRHGPSTGSGPS